MLAQLYFQMTVPLVHAEDDHHGIGEEDHNKSSPDQRSHSKNHSQNHSDDLLTLLGYKIKLQKLQSNASNTHVSNAQQTIQNLEQQGRLLQRAMPVLNAYMAVPKSYYLTTDMYHDSLENRAAMLTDFSNILVTYQKQLVSSR